MLLPLYQNIRKQPLDFRRLASLQLLVRGLQFYRQVRLEKLAALIDPLN